MSLEPQGVPPDPTAPGEPSLTPPSQPGSVFMPGTAPSVEADPGWRPPPQPDTGPVQGVEFAPHGPRLLAYLIDVLIIALLTAALAVVISFFAGRERGFLVVLAFIALFVLTVAYFPVFWFRGQTPGMRVFNLYVVSNEDGEQIDPLQAVIRLVGWWISFAVVYLGFIWIFVDKRRRGWADLMAGTLVVHRRP